MSRGSRKLAVLFLAVVLPSAAALVWLGWQLLEQDREVWAKREAERRELMMDQAARELDDLLKASLRQDVGPYGVTLNRSSLTVTRGRLPWVPRASTTLWKEDPSIFAEAESAEYQGRFPAAVARYEALTKSPGEAVRAGAWMRIARVNQQRKMWDAALAAYRELEKVRGVELLGMPANLLARRAACSLLEQSGRQQDLAVAANALEADFLKNTWELDRESWRLTQADLERWTGRRVEVTPQSQVLVAAVDQLAKEPENFVGDRRRTMYVAGVDVTLVERSDAQGDRVVLLLPEAIREWVRKLKIEGSLSLLTEHGRVVAGESSAEGSLKRVGAVTGLPWTLSLSTDLTPGMKELATRRRLLGAGLALIVLLLAGGSYLLWRLVRQELAVARLQTEFVAAVSHEFRTPLASLRHVTELLEEDDELPRGERSKFYAVLGRNTERLNRLVESLLDFSRMEGGRKPYVLRKVDARALTEQIVSAFRADVPEGFAVNLNMDDGDLTVNADAESLSHALWNVLDNAVKYSGDSRTVMVSVRKRGDGVVFSVEDQGLGIPQAERSEIFDRFVRGAKAHELGIKGTGLGLAMVAHIVEAHRGKVEVDSKEGEGSTFRVVLPVA